MKKYKRKLLITASTFPRYDGDSEPRFILDLAKELKAYFEVTVLVPACPEATDYEVLEGVKVIRYHYFPIHKWETLCYPGAIVPRIKEKKIRILLVPFLFLGLKKKLKRIGNQFDIIHAHWLIPQGIVQSFFKKPYIVTGHGGDVKMLNGFPIRQLKRKCLERAAAVTVVSEELKRSLPVYGKAGLSTRVSVIPMGCDVEKFHNGHRVENFFRQGEKKVVLFVGRLAEKKGLAYLLDAMETVDALLVLVGDGPLQDMVSKRREQINYNEGYEKIKMLGVRNHMELPVIYASADIMTVPSVTASNGDAEGLPTVIVEALASGLPVVATRHGGIGEVIRDGENGLLVEERDSIGLGNSIKRLVEDSGLCGRLSRNARESILCYDYKQIAERYAELSWNIIEEKKMLTGR